MSFPFWKRLSPHTNGTKWLWGDRFEGHRGRTGRRAWQLYSGKQNHRAESRQKVRRQQEYGAYGSDKLERLIWAIQ